MLTTCDDIDVCFYVFLFCVLMFWTLNATPPFAKANGSLTDLHPNGASPSVHTSVFRYPTKVTFKSPISYPYLTSEPKMVAGKKMQAEILRLKK